jgi:hypothetical protein
MVNRMYPELQVSTAPSAPEPEGDDRFYAVDYERLPDISQQDLDEANEEYMDECARKHHYGLVQSILGAQRRGETELKVEDKQVLEYVKFLQTNKKKFLALRVHDHGLSWGSNEAEKMYEYLKDHPNSVIYFRTWGTYFVTTNPIQDNAKIECSGDLYWENKEACIGSAEKGNWKVFDRPPFIHTDGWDEKVMSVRSLPSGDLPKKTQEQASVMYEHLKLNPHSMIAIYFESKWYMGIIKEREIDDDNKIWVTYSDGKDRKWENKTRCIRSARNACWVFLFP